MKKEKTIVYRKLSEIVKLESNPRKIKDVSFNSLCESIKNNPDYFEARPIILSDRTGEMIIIAGNQRYDAAKKIGLNEVPTFLMTGLTEEREKEITIRDNVSNGEWDYDILTNEWDQENLKEWGVSVKQYKNEEDQPEEFSLEDNDLHELYIKVSKHWFENIHRDIRKKIKESEITDEVIEMFTYVLMYYNYCKTSKKRFSIVVPMSLDYCRKFSIDINSITNDFQRYLYEKYSKPAEK